MEGRKKGGPTHSQWLGIVWLSVGLILVAAVAFFSSRHPSGEAPAAASDTLGKRNLDLREDSAVHIRRQNSRKHHEGNVLRERRQRLDSTFYSHAAPPPTRQPLVVELNGADTLTLQLLHGIGPAYARRIVGYRQRLGGYVSTAQLLEVYGFTPELLAHLEPSLRIDTAKVSRIAINSVGLKQLARHPYIEYYQARDLVRLRQGGVRFRSADDLRAVPSMADSTLRRLLPYLDFGDSIISAGADTIKTTTVR